jgi:hypothetical protein
MDKKNLIIKLFKSLRGEKSLRENPQIGELVKKTTLTIIFFSYKCI